MRITNYDQAYNLLKDFESDFFMPIQLAMWALESDHGDSELARNANNYSGHKYRKGEWPADKVYPKWTEEDDGTGKKYMVKADFRKYDDAQEWAKHHTNWLQRLPDTYAEAINAKTVEEQAQALQGTYATDTKYAEKLMTKIQKDGLMKYPSNRKGDNIMTTHLIIAGHGRNPNNGYFDPGATGHISMGEHRYMRDVLFPLMKKYIPEGVKVIFFSDYNVYSKGNLVALAKAYGNDTIVTEMHFDATGNDTASGGHIIIHKDFKADAIDLALRDAVKNVIGLAYPIHRGDKGISGRSDLANPNRAANGGINYRLPELGFGTNPRDAKIMLNEADKYARALCKALFGSVKEENKEQPVELEGVHIVVHGEYLWLIAEKYGITVQDLKDWNKLTSNIIYTGQVLKVAEPEKVIEEGEPDPEVSTPVEDQPVDEGEETEAIELEPWHFYDNETGKVYKISETELVYSK